MRVFTDEEIISHLNGRLTADRMRHSLAVAGTARSYAPACGVDPDRAWLAGLVHDCGKLPSEKEIISECRKRGVVLDGSEAAFPGLAHAKLGEAVASGVYGITDGGILSAVRWHTTGKPDMTALEKIIFLADITEPERDYPGIGRIRRLAGAGRLDEAMLAGLDSLLTQLISKGSTIQTDSVLARNHIIALLGRRA